MTLLTDQENVSQGSSQAPLALGEYVKFVLK